MTLRTVTYDDRSHKIVPREATEKMVSGALSGRILPQSCEILRRVRQSTKADLEAAIAAAPEYQDTCTDGGKCGAGGYCKDCIQEPTKDE